MFVPVVDPGSHVGFEGLDASMVAALQVTDEVDFEVVGDFVVHLGQELLELGGAVPAVQAAAAPRFGCPLPPPEGGRSHR